LKKYIFLAFTSLALVGCGASSDGDTTATSIEDTAALEAKSDTAVRPDNIQQDLPSSITEDDRKRIVAYGACHMIRQSAISILNDQKQRGISGPEVDPVIGTLAYQAAVYEVLSSEFYGKYKNIIDQDSFLAIANEWRTNVYLPFLRENQYRLNLSQVQTWSQDVCTNWSHEEATRVERQYGDNFTASVERKKSFMIPTVQQ
jgi:hypothetical protein